jgi:parallel beta-helix repeat protein
VGNSGFTPANGTRGGDGSLSNPYIIEGWSIAATNADGILIEQTNASFIIRNVFIHGSSQFNGIFFFNVTNGVVDNTTITNSIDGITMTLSNATIENSHISTNTEDGIRIIDGENVNLFNNTLTQEMGAGIYSESCVKCALNITRNTIISNLSGIVLESMNNSFVFENRITSNKNDGIGVYRSTYVVLVLNNITDNGVGADLVTSTNNLVHHNNFVNNHVKQAFDNETGQNMWDVGYASGGNHWSDYTGVDNCSGPAQNVCPRSDGIGDTPYTFANARDNYPLMKLFVQSVIHDVAVSSITPSATIVNQTGTISITVTVTNEGAVTENFTLTLYYDRIVIGSQLIQPLDSGASQAIRFDWNTTRVTPGPHKIKAVETTVWGEIDVADNTLVAGPILVKAPNTTPPPSGSPTHTPPSPDIFAETAIGLLLLVLLAVVAYRRRGRTR